LLRFSVEQGLAFLAALLVIALWLVSEPYFHYSDTWQLFINTAPQSSLCCQKRDARALHLNSSLDQAQNEMIGIEHLSDDELQKFADKYQKVRVEWDNRSRRRKQKD
jgi:low affinity Fe/Cu permease